MDPKQMAKLMQQMGIKNTEVEAARVVVEKPDGSSLVVDNPSVVLIEMQGQKSLQVSGEIREEAGAGGAGGGGDAEIVMQQTGCSKEDAERALADADGDLAAAILKLKKD